MYLKLYLSAGLIGLASCQSLPSTQEPIRLEAEVGYKNSFNDYFEKEDAAFYSGGAAVMISGRVPVGRSGTIEYDLQSRISPGVYSLTVQYNDENDGHSPVDIWVDDQQFSFVMNADTSSAFADIGNQRRIRFDNVHVKKGSTLKVRGTVHRYKSEHKELVRLDYFEFTPNR